MRGLRMGRIAAFLLLTFALSWGFSLLVAVTVGHGAVLELGLSPLDMLFPAFVALILRLFIFEDSPLHFRRYRGKPRWILYAFLPLTVVYGIVTFLGLWSSGQSVVFAGVGSLLTTLWTLLALFVGGQSGEADLEQAGLQLGDTDWGLRLVLGAIAFFVLQAGLNLLLGLGQFRGPAEGIYGVSVPAGLYPVGLIVAFLLAVTGVPLSGLAVVFGEEYGWRGFLQDELGGLGQRRGALVIGLIWGLWHFPVILSGVHTYPPTVLGLSLGLVFFVLFGFVQSYAVLKTGSIWVAAFLHGLVNSVYGFINQYVVRPDDKVFSFGLGVYGLVCLAVIVLFVLRDPVWGTGTSEGAGEVQGGASDGERD